MKKILIIDDQPSLITSLENAFKCEGYQIASTVEPEQVLSSIQQFKPDLITLDLHFGDGKEKEGITILRRIRQQWSNDQLPVLILSGHGDAEMLPILKKLGIAGYVCKPIEDYDAFIEKVANSFEREQDKDRNLNEVPDEKKIIAKSNLFLEILDNLYDLADIDADIFIEGEVGTGKDMLAREYWKYSSRRDKSFNMIDCTNISESLFETELFGCKKDVHSRAFKDQKGKVELAEGGVLFFNEIGDLPLSQQKKILTLLQDKTYTPIGGSEQHADVVIISATNKDLSRMVEEGSFRRDLYTRILGHKIENPPLREHKEDISELIDHFIQVFNYKYRKQIMGCKEEVLECFNELSWKGYNIRVLKKCIQVGVQNCVGKTIGLKDMESILKTMNDYPYSENKKLEKPVGKNKGLKIFSEFQEYVETQRQQLFQSYITSQLKEHDWNIAATARAIETSAENLKYFIRKYKINIPNKENR